MMEELLFILFNGPKLESKKQKNTGIRKNVWVLNDAAQQIG